MHIRTSLKIGSVSLILLLIGISVLSAGCLSSDEAAPSGVPQNYYTSSSTVYIGSAAFNPQVLVIERGVSVTWVNIDSVPHSVKSVRTAPETFTSKPLLTGEVFHFTFSQSGTYDFYSTDRPSMRGSIIVTG